MLQFPSRERPYPFRSFSHMHILLANTQFVNTKIEFILKKTVSFIKTNSFTYSNFYKKRVFSMTLDEIRKRIDAIDEQLLPLFIERMKCAQDVAQAKRELSLPIFNAQRENEILARVAADAGDFAPVLFLMRPQHFCSLTAMFIHTRVLKMYLKLSKTELWILDCCRLRILPLVLWLKYMILS